MQGNTLSCAGEVGPTRSPLLTRLLAAAALASFAALGAGTAYAQSGVTATPVPKPDTSASPPTVVVGNGFVYDLTFQNTSSPDMGSVFVAPGDIFLVPSCTTDSASTCVAPEPFDLFSFSDAATGQTGGSPSCAGATFTVAPVPGDPEHRIRFTSANPVELTAAGTPGDKCTIRFSATVLRLPTVDAYPEIAGLQTNAIAVVRARQNADGTGVVVQGSGNAPISVRPRIKPQTLRFNFVRCRDHQRSRPSSRLATRGRPSATIAGPTGCQDRPFKVRVTSKGSDEVVFRLDRKKIDTDRKPPYVVRIDPRKLKPGRHRVRAKIKYE